MKTKSHILALTALLILSCASPVALSQTQSPSLNVVYTINLDHSYQIYGVITQKIGVNISGIVEPRTAPTFVVGVFPFSYSRIVGLSRSENYSLRTIQGSGGTSTIVTVMIPGNERSFAFTVEGSLSGLSSVFFRNIAEVPPISVEMNAPPYSPSTLNVLIPMDSSTQIRAVYPTGSSEQVTMHGISYLQLNQQAISAGVGSPGVSLVYQSYLSNYYAFILMAALAGTAYLSPLVVRKARGPLRQIWRTLPSTGRILLQRFVRRRGPKTLLTILVAVCLAMISLSTVFGPPPEPRAYLAATTTVSILLGPYVTQAGWSYLNTAEAADGFSRTSQLGTFSAVVIADYPPEIVGSSPFQLGLDYVPRIVVLRGYVSSSYLTQLLALHPDNTLVVNSPTDLAAALARIGGRPNVLGFSVSGGVYTSAAALVGLLSFLVPFFALAFFASFLIDLKGSGAGGILEAIAYSVMIYFVAEFAFIVSSVMLGTPVALHAAISNKETAEGFLGPFGGGSRPRELSGTLGFLFGVAYNKKGSLSYDRNVLAAVAAGFAFIVIDPLNVASALYEVLLTVSNSSSVGVSGPVYEFLRGIISQPLNLFQSYVTAGYVASHGAVLFFLSAIPFALYPRVGRGVGTVLLLFSALGCGLGFIRIADMVPMETVASVAPGLLVGVLLIPAFWTLSKLEAIVRSRS